MKTEYQSYDFWFNDTKEHSGIDEYNESYYAYRIYENLVSNFPIPQEGNIVVLGTHNCLSFNLLCKLFGEMRCVGYDLYNPSGHPEVICKDCNTLSDSDNIPIAFCHNDVGSFPKTPGLKLHAQLWALKNLIPGGILLGRNNHNSLEFNLEYMAETMGCVNVQFKEFGIDLSFLSKDEIESHMISVKATK